MTERHRGTPQKREALLMSVIGLTFLLGVLLTAVLVRGAELAAQWSTLLFFAALTIAAELLNIDLPGGGSVSVGFAVTLAAIAVLKPGLAAVSVAAGGLVADTISQSRSPKQLVYNFGQIVLAISVSGLTFAATGGNIGHHNVLSNAIPFALASIVFFVINASMVTLAVSLASGKPFVNVWALNVKWSVASYLALAPLGVLIAIIYRNYSVGGTLLLLVPLLFARYSFLQYLSARQAHISVTQALAAALEAKDQYTRGHSDRVAEYAEELGKELNFTEDKLDTLRYSAQMHDIGKIGISESLLRKPGRLSEDELVEIRRHAAIGANILGGIEFLSEVANNIMYHHEWFDGSGGYPRKLRGEEIPLGARILMVCDSFDAMTSNRPYRGAMPLKDAIEQLRSGSGTQFDPNIVIAFVAILERKGETDASS